MKIKNKIIVPVIAGLVLALPFSSCVDEIKFGNSFLEKAPGGQQTKDTVFNSAKYTRQFLTGIYALQYYGLPFHNEDKFPYPNDTYRGKFECLSDCWQNQWSSSAISSVYYAGSHSATYGLRQEKFDYLKSNVWEAVRSGWLLIENIDGVPDLSDNEKKRMVAEAKCLIATRYFDMFRHYGGLPIIRASFTGTENGYEMPRASVEETVKFIIGLLDEAKGDLPWAYTGADAQNEAGRWTRAGAIGMKCRIWNFAASPLFNDTEAYYPGASSLSIWYGGYKPELWDNCLKACEEFFTESQLNGGIYALEQATGSRPEDYRLAFRKAYATQGSTEMLHSTRVATGVGSKYNWWEWNNNERLSYNPTQEYVEMFPWSDGKPFNWEETENEGKLDAMFTTGTVEEGVVLTRDPRLYESAIVNGMQKQMDWNTGNMSGTIYELWSGGTDAKEEPANVAGKYTAGYANNKFYMDTDYKNVYAHWAYLRLPEIYLIYAEALVQTGGSYTDAIDNIDKVRSRVGLKGLVTCNPGKNLTTDKKALLEEILRERVCELGMEDVRFFDMIRYKMKERFETPLHGLLMQRLNANGEIAAIKPWYGGDRANGVKQPTHFSYEKFVFGNRRIWWDNGFDPKWYLSPFPSSEVNKGYGLEQNPGW